jgi:GNAT superfamily N-acetyltransferase
MPIHQIDPSSHRDVRRFVDLPFRLYQQTPQWCPPLVADEIGLLNRQKHLFYRHGDAAFFLAEEGGQTIGRLAVMEDRRLNEYLHRRTALFALFESVEDRAASGMLFEAAFAWARARGLTEIIGPFGFGPGEATGILVEGFEHRAVMGLPYNLPYYDALVQDCGFVPENGSLTGYLWRDRAVIPERAIRAAEKIQERRGFWVKSFRNKKEMRQIAPRVMDALITSFTGNYMFVPPTEEEKASAAEWLLALVEPELVKVVMKGEEVAGFIFSYPDLSDGLRRARGRLWPLGWWRLLRERRRTRTVLVNGIGVLPQYQGLGASILLYAELGKLLKTARFPYAEAIQVGEDNTKSREMAEMLGVTWHKRHRNYRREL